MKTSKKIAVLLLAVMFFVSMSMAFCMMQFFVRADDDASVAFGTINERYENKVVDGCCFGMYGSGPVDTVPQGSQDPYSERYAFYFKDTYGNVVDGTKRPDIVKILKTPIDITGLTGEDGAYVANTALTFWIYFSSLDGVTGDSTIQIGTGHNGRDVYGKCLVGEKNGWLTNVWNDMQPGWNKVSVNLGKMTKYSVGTAVETTAELPDFSNISYIRFNWGSDFDETKTGVDTQFRMGLTDVRFEKTEQTELYKVVETQPIGYSDSVEFSDTKTNILSDPTQGTVSEQNIPDVNDKSASTSSIIGNVGIGGLELKLGNSVDASKLTASRRALSIWIYINKANYFAVAGDAALQISSSGSWESEIYGYPLKGMAAQFKDGWNHVLMRIPSDHGVNFEGLNYIRLYAVGGSVDGEIQMGVNNIQIVDANFLEDFRVAAYADIPDEEPDAPIGDDGIAFGQIDKRVDGVDVINNVFGMYGSDYRNISAKNAIEQNSEIYAFFHPSNPSGTNQFVVSKTLYTPIDLTRISTNEHKIALTFWIYFSKVDGIVDNPTTDDTLIQIGNTENMDVENELRINFYNAVQNDLVAGWNKISVNLGKMTQNGTVDLSSIRFVRMYMPAFNEANTKMDTGFRMALSDVRFVPTTQADAIVVADTEPIGYDSENIVDFSDTTTNILTDPTQGTLDKHNIPNVNDGSVSNSSIIGYEGAKVFELKLENSVDASNLTAFRRALSVWIYINKADYFAVAGDAALQISSSGSWESNVYGYPLKGIAAQFKDGWNHVLMRIPSDSGVNFEGLNYIRLYAVDGSVGGDIQMGVNNIQIVEVNFLEDFRVITYAGVPDYTIDETGIAFGKIDKRENGVDVINNVFGMWGSDYRNISAKNAIEQNSEIYTFFNPNNIALTKQFDVSKTLYNPIDLTQISSSKNNVALTFWIYFSKVEGIVDTSKNIADTLIEIGNTETFDVYNELRVNFFNAVQNDLVAGWNKISINLGKMQQNGTVDLSSIRFIRMYMPALNESNTNMNTGFRMALSDVRFVPTTQTDAIVVADTEPIQIFNNQVVTVSDTRSFDGWNNQNGQIVTDNVPENSAQTETKSAIMLNKTSQLNFVWQGNVNLSETTYSNNKMALSMWLYVNDTLLLAKSSSATLTVNFTSSAGAEAETMNLNSIAGRLVNGWNQIGFKISNDARDVTVASVDSITLSVSGSGDLQFGVHDLRIVETNVVDPWVIYQSEKDKTISSDVLSNGDSTESWSAVTVENNSNAHKDGASLLVENGAASVDKTFTTPIDMSAYDFDNMVLGFWIYIENVDALSLLTVSFGSDDNANYFSYAMIQANARINRALTQANVRNGWNNVQISVPAMAKTGEVDMSEITFVKFAFEYVEENSDVEIRIDDIVTYLRTDAEEFTVLEYIAYVAPGAVNVENVVSIGTTDTAKGFSHHTIGLYKEKGPTDKGAILAVSGHDIGVMYSFQPQDFTDPTVLNINNAVLSFWIYFNDVDKLTGVGSVEFTSVPKATVDEVNKYAWSFSSFKDGLQSGWNKVVLKIGGDENLNGFIDLSSMCFFRLYNVSGAPYLDEFQMKMLISDIQVYETDVTKLDAAQVTEHKAFLYAEPLSSDVIIEELDNGVGGGSQDEFSPYVPPQVDDGDLVIDVDKTADVLLIVIPVIVGVLAVAAAVVVKVLLKKKN